MKKIAGQEFRVYIREFLNEEGHESTAFIYATVERSKSSSRWGYSRVELKISDCSRVIDLNFNLDDKQGRKNSLKKVDKIINSMKEFRKGLVAEMKVADTRERKEEERRAQEKNKKKSKNKGS